MLDNKMRLSLLGVFVLLTVLVIGWWNFPFGENQREASSLRRFQTVQLGEQSLEVVLSETPAEIQQGLSDQPTLGADGMLFVLPTKSIPSFWMYHMQFPLDFIWIADGAVVDLHRNIPPPPVGTAEQEIVQVRPSAASEYVLEVPAGFIDQFGITMGTPFQLTGEPVDKTWGSSKLLQE